MAKPVVCYHTNPTFQFIRSIIRFLVAFWGKKPPHEFGIVAIINITFN